MRTLAKEFDLSDVALHKICRKHDIPTPPVGYWAKVAHGKKVIVKPLPKPKPGAQLKIVIHEGAATHESEAMSVARAAARERLSDTSNAQAARNPIVERTVTMLERARPDRLGLLQSAGKGMIAVQVRPDSVERAGRILDQLVGAATAAGIELHARKASARWECDGETITVELVELADQVEHVATEKELAAHAKWERKRDEDHRRWGYLSNYGEPKIPKWEARIPRAPRHSARGSAGPKRSQLVGSGNPSPVLGPVESRCEQGHSSHC